MLVGIHDNTVVAVYDIDLTGTAYIDGKFRFAGTPSTAWAHLVGQPNPGKAWGQQGYARSVCSTSTLCYLCGAPSAILSPGDHPDPGHLEVYCDNCNCERSPATTFSPSRTRWPAANVTMWSASCGRCFGTAEDRHHLP